MCASWRADNGSRAPQAHLALKEWRAVSVGSQGVRRLTHSALLLLATWSAKLRTLRSLKATNDSLDAARVEAQAIAAKATTDLREAWACNAVWYGRALAAEKQLNPSAAPASTPPAATLDSVGSRCGYDRVASMLATVSAENSSLRIKLSSAATARDQAEAAAAATSQHRDSAVAHVETLQKQIVKLTAKSQAAETKCETLERLERDTRKQLEAAQAQL